MRVWSEFEGKEERRETMKGWRTDTSGADETSVLLPLEEDLKPS